MNERSLSLAAMGFLLLMFLYASLFVVREGELGVVLRLGQLLKDPETGIAIQKGPGIHIKWPLIERARIFDARLQALDIASSRVMTAEKKELIVDYYAKWRIADLPLFFVRTNGNVRQAELLLQQQLNDGLRAEFARRNVKDVVSGERVNIMHWLKNQAQASGKELGMAVMDVRIKRIDLPNEVSATVFERMRAERQRIATQHRATGRAQAEAIRAEAERNATIIVAEAQSKAEQIRGEGDAEASRTYAQAYGQDVDFFSFYQSLRAYQKGFSQKQDVLVLKPQSDFFRYWQQLPKGTTAP